MRRSRLPQPSSSSSSAAATSSSFASLPLTRISTVCPVLRFVRITGLRDIIKLAHISPTFREALESYSTRVWRRVASNLERRLLRPFSRRNAFAWIAQTMRAVGQLDVDEHPILFAAENGALDVVRACLAEDPACVDVREHKYDNTALPLASRRGHTEIVRELLAAGAEVVIGEQRRSRDIPLYAALLHGHVDCVRLLLERVDFAKLRIRGGWVELHAACFCGDAECVRKLLAAGVNISITDITRFDNDREYTALLRAAEGGHVDVVRLLAAHRKFAETRDQGDRHGYTALQYAARGGHSECVRVLLAAGADITIANGGDYTALHYAASGGFVDVVRSLVAHPDFAAIRDERNNEDQTALLLACKGDHADCVRELVAGGADISMPDEYDFGTALHYAAEHGRIDLVRRLIAHPDFNKIRDQRNCNGKNASNLASDNGHTECVRELLAAGAHDDEEEEEEEKEEEDDDCGWTTKQVTRR